MNKEANISIRLPLSELYELDEKAKCANLTRSMFVRAALKENTIPEMKNKAEIINAISRISYLNTQNTDYERKEQITKEVAELCRYLR